jgi:hypothetical protein
MDTYSGAAIVDVYGKNIGDEVGDWVTDKIGTYDGPGPEQGFVPYEGMF